jgi:putative ABC transport system substrate-binding protein
VSAKVKRREFMTLLGGATAWPLARRASAQSRPVRIGVLGATPPAAVSGGLSALREALRERGYIVGQNLSIEYRWPSGSFEQISEVANDLVRSNVDIIVAWASVAVAAARRATSTIPIVMVSVGDPVGTGFVASLARPGGNVTGVSNISIDLSGKLIELFREIVPGLNHIGIIGDPNNPILALQLRDTRSAIEALGLQFTVVHAYTSAEYESAFARLNAAGVRGVVVLPDPSVVGERWKIAELAQKIRLPTAFQRRENVEAGGLFSYGARLNDQFRQAAFYVERILKGVKPADLPVEQPTKFELVINLKTARALGLTVPSTILPRADEVIE